MRRKGAGAGVGRGVLVIHGTAAAKHGEAGVVRHVSSADLVDGLLVAFGRDEQRASVCSGTGGCGCGSGCQWV